jgi:hypothetical protein
MITAWAMIEDGATHLLDLECESHVCVLGSGLSTLRGSGARRWVTEEMAELVAARVRASPPIDP